MFFSKAKEIDKLKKQVYSLETELQYKNLNLRQTLLYLEGKDSVIENLNDSIGVYKKQCEEYKEKYEELKEKYAEAVATNYTLVQKIERMERKEWLN